MKIQKMWRGYTSRTQTRKKKHEEMILIGMLPDPKQDPTIQENIDLIRRQRHKTQSEYYQLYLDSLKRFEDEINNKQGAPMTEDMAEEIRNWFKDYFNRTGKLPDFPSEEAGGSRHLLSRQGEKSSSQIIYAKLFMRVPPKEPRVNSADLPLLHQRNRRKH